jgi:hypothetical protein
MGMSLAEHYREWLQRLPHMPADRMAMALAAVDAFAACERKRRITPADLTPLVVAASSHYTPVCGTGCNLLVQLATRHPAAQQCLVQLARDKKATARLNVVIHLHPTLPERVRLEIVEVALNDRSAKVRRLGVERAERFQFTRFLARLEAMQQTETNESVRHALARHIPILRDGFLLEPSGDGDGYFLTVRSPDGGLGGPFIPNEMYSKAFVRQEVARLQAAKPWKRGKSGA